MTKEIIGLLAGLMVTLTVIPYGIRTWQGKINPNITTWGLWSLIGFSLLLTYKGSGAGANVWPAVFGFINPCIITVIAVYRKGERTSFNKAEKICVALCLLSLLGWWWFRAEQDLVQYALYASIIADACAGIPTVIFVWRQPDGDRPFAWVLFAMAHTLAIFSIPEQTVANYALPVWMITASTIISIPIVWHRVQNRVPLKEWI